MSKLCEPIKREFSKAMDKSIGKPELQAELFETLCTQLSMCISSMSKGHPKAMNDLVEGASNYLMERTAGFQKLGSFMEFLAEERRKS